MENPNNPFDFNSSIENKDERYLLSCLKMSSKERFLKGIELSEWSIKLCRNIDEELAKRSTNSYPLK
jgi:hypothetical protein